MSEFKLGQEVQDTISGFKGIVTCVSDWLYGCTRIGIQPQGLDKDNRRQETEFFDEARIVLLGPGLLKEKEEKPRSPGGPDRERPNKEHY